MASKKTSVRASAKSTNKDKTDKARKSVSQEIAERIAKMEAAESNGVLHEAEVTRGDGETVKVAVPADEAATLATDAAGDAPAPDAAKPAKTRRGATSGKKGAKAPKPAKEPKAKTEKSPKPAKPKRLSCLDAAAQVLAASGEPLRPKQMIEMMEAKGLWKSGKGLTPEATLYAGIIREIAAKGKDARFKKHDRGVFVAGKGAN